MSALEKALENWAKAEAKKLGIIVLKLALLGGGGFPDHTFIKDGKVGFLEYKKDEKSRFQPLQKYWLKKLNGAGLMARVAWTKDQVREFLDDFTSK